VIAAIRSAYQRAAAFVRRQPANFKLMLLRRSIHGLALNLSAQYNSIYATVLGASPVQLGSLQSVGNVVGALIALPTGWFIDRHSLKKTFLVATGLIIGSSLLYFGASHWSFLYAAVILLRMGIRTTCTSCTVVGARELPNRERATGRGLCQSLSSVVSLLTPLLAAWIVSAAGGLNRFGLRSLYIIQAGLFVLIFLFLLFFFRDTAVPVPQHRQKLVKDFAEIFKEGPVVVRFLIMMALMEIPWFMIGPFVPLYAHQFKGADEFILAGLGTARFLAALLFAIPMGRLADRFGRKKLLFAVAPLSYASNVLLILAPGAKVLLLAGFSFAFYGISTSLANAMAAELAPKERMGRWIGTVGLLRGLISIPMPLLAGMIWDHIGAMYVFIVAVLVDALVRLPLLLTIPETLNAGGGPGSEPGRHPE